MVNLWATNAGAHHLKYRKGIVIDIDLADWNVLWLLGIYLPFQNFQMQKELDQASYIMSVWTYMMSSDPCGSKKLKPIVKPCCQQWLQHPEKKTRFGSAPLPFPSSPASWRLGTKKLRNVQPLKASNSHSIIPSHSAPKKKVRTSWEPSPTWSESHSAVSAWETSCSMQNPCRVHVGELRKPISISWFFGANKRIPQQNEDYFCTCKLQVPISRWQLDHLLDLSSLRPWAAFPGHYQQGIWFAINIRQSEGWSFSPGVLDSVLEKPHLGQAKPNLANRKTTLASRTGLCQTPQWLLSLKRLKDTQLRRSVRLNLQKTIIT